MPVRRSFSEGGKKRDTIIIDGKAYSWKRILEQRRDQLKAWKAAAPQQPALFELKDDRRPEPERSAAGRYLEPTLMTYLQERE